MKYILTEINENLAEIIASWKYEGEYSVYNYPSLEEMKATNHKLLDSKYKDNYIGFLDNNKRLIAIMSFEKKENNVVFIGILLAPYAIGKGLGKNIFQQGLKTYLEKFDVNMFTLKVRHWNKRAIKCYENVGFKMVKTKMSEGRNGDILKFIFMELSPNKLK